MTTIHLTHQQLQSVGLTVNDIRAQLRQGSLTRVRRGIYALERPRDDTDLHRLMIAGTVPLTDESSVVSHTSAAVIHGLPVPNSDLEKVTMTRMSAGHGDTSPVLKVRKTRLESADITEIGGLRTTTLARTVADQCRTLPFEWGLITVDAALRRGLTRMDVSAVLAAQKGLHGRAKALNVLGLADALSESPAESLSRARFHQLGLPIPVLQPEFFDADGIFVARSDFLWPEAGLIGEVDGKSKYWSHLRPGETAAEAVMREKERENALRDLGFWVIRWGWNEAWTATELHRRILTGLRIAASRPAPQGSWVQADLEIARGA